MRKNIDVGRSQLCYELLISLDKSIGVGSFRILGGGGGGGGGGPRLRILGAPNSQQAHDVGMMSM